MQGFSGGEESMKTTNLSEEEQRQFMREEIYFFVFKVIAFLVILFVAATLSYWLGWIDY